MHELHTGSTVTIWRCSMTANGILQTTRITLSRRARGLPFWFSLATHGTKAYSDAVEKTIRTTHAAARLINALKLPITRWPKLVHCRI